MKPLDFHHVLSSACREAGLPGVYLRFDPQIGAEGLLRSAPWLVGQDVGCLLGGYGIVLFETEHQMQDAYMLTTGEFGSHRNPCPGPPIYVLCCDALGNLVRENDYLSGPNPTAMG
jgi:hypothetical protein